MESIQEVHLPLLPQETLVACYAQQRPRRNGGYLLRVDTHSNKILVHNYGHGGAGVSLAPGCAIEAVKLAKRSLPHIPTAAVVGCGVIGLFTCRELLRQCPGVQVRVYASRVPRFGEKENGRLITSQVAPGLWFPFHYGRQNDQENQRIASLSFAEYQQMSEQVEWKAMVQRVELFDLTDQKEMQEEYSNNLFPEIAPSYKATTVVLNGKTTLPCFKFSTIKIDMQPFLEALIHDLISKGVQFEERTLDETAILSLPHSAVFNCTGLSSRTLFKDGELRGVKGHLLEYRNPDPRKYNCFFSANVGKQAVDYYIHGSRILLGLTEEDNDDCQVEAQQVQMLQEAHRKVLQKFHLVPPTTPLPPPSKL